MLVTEEKSISSETIKDVICDCCEKSCKKYECIVDNPLRHDHGQKSYVFEYMDLKADWGYWSKSDGEKWTAQICQECVTEKLKFIKFKKSDQFTIQKTASKE